MAYPQITENKAFFSVFPRKSRKASKYSSFEGLFLMEMPINTGVSGDFSCIEKTNSRIKSAYLGTKFGLFSAFWGRKKAQNALI